MQTTKTPAIRACLFFSAKNTVLALIIENVCVYYTKFNNNTPLVNRLQRGGGNLLKTEKDNQKEKEKNMKDIYLYIN